MEVMLKCDSPAEQNADTINTLTNRRRMFSSILDDSRKRLKILKERFCWIKPRALSSGCYAESFEVGCEGRSTGCSGSEIGREDIHRAAKRLERQTQTKATGN
jgi:hypothetical protein